MPCCWISVQCSAKDHIKMITTGVFSADALECIWWQMKNCAWKTRGEKLKSLRPSPPWRSRSRSASSVDGRNDVSCMSAAFSHTFSCPSLLCHMVLCCIGISQQQHLVLLCLTLVTGHDKFLLLSHTRQERYGTASATSVISVLLFQSQLVGV